MLTAKISAYFHPTTRRPVFKNLDFQLTAGKTACLLGLSGVGKTTLLRVLLSLAPGRFEGHITYDVDGSTYSPQALRSRGKVGILSQDAALIPWLNVYQNLLAPTKMNHQLKRPPKEQLEKALLGVGMEPPDLIKMPHQLSFGMQHRVALARAVLYGPPFLLLDEVFTGLDPVNAELVSKVLAEYVDQHAATCLLVTHDVDRALELGDLVYHLSRQGLTLLPSNITRGAVLDILAQDLATSREIPN